MSLVTVQGILWGGGTLITVLFLRYVVLADLYADLAALRRRASKPRRRVYPTVHRVTP